MAIVDSRIIGDELSLIHDLDLDPDPSSIQLQLHRHLAIASPPSPRLCCHYKQNHRRMGKAKARLKFPMQKTQGNSLARQ